jgi:hypothetical protein
MATSFFKRHGSSYGLANGHPRVARRQVDLGKAALISRGRRAGVLLPFISAAAQIMVDPRINRRFVWQSLIALGLFAFHCALGMVVLLLARAFYAGHEHDEMAVAAPLAWLGWLGLGGLSLMRYAPGTTDPPRWLMHFGVADIIFLLMITAGLAWVVVLFFRQGA